MAHLQSFGLHEIKLGGRPVVMMPYFDQDGNQVATRFRVGLDGNRRFIWKKGSRASLYGLSRLRFARDAGYAVIFEGESDCQTAWLHNVPAVGLPGNTQWNEDRDAAHLADITTVYAIIEPGKSGAGMQRHLARSSIQPRLRLVHFSNGVKDISALHLADPEGFRAAFQAMLDSAEPCPPPPELTPDGPYYREFWPFSIDEKTGLTYTHDPEKSPLWLAAAFEVVGRLRNHLGEAWGLQLRWRDHDGRRHQWAMPIRLIARRQEEVLEPLLDGGLKISPVPAARQLLIQYLGAVEADQRAWVTGTVGWLAAEGFVLPLDSDDLNQ